MRFEDNQPNMEIQVSFYMQMFSSESCWRAKYTSMHIYIYEFHKQLQL